MADEHEGGCLCGVVRYRVTDEPYLAGVCHCSQCKKRTGSALGVAMYFDESAVQIKSGALKTYEYRSDESNRRLKLEFCSNCGTTVSWTADFFQARGEFPEEHSMIPAGSSLRATILCARRCIRLPLLLTSLFSKPYPNSIRPALRLSAFLPTCMVKTVQRAPSPIYLVWRCVVNSEISTF